MAVKKRWMRNVRSWSIRRSSTRINSRIKSKMYMKRNTKKIRSKRKW